MKRYILPLYVQKNKHHQLHFLIVLDKGYTQTIHHKFTFCKGYKLKYVDTHLDTFPLLSMNGVTKRQSGYLFKHLKEHQVDYQHVYNQLITVKAMELISKVDKRFANQIKRILFSNKYLTPLKILIGNTMAKYFHFHIDLEHELLSHKFNANMAENSMFTDLVVGGLNQNSPVHDFDINPFIDTLLRDKKILRSKHLI